MFSDKFKYRLRIRWQKIKFGFYDLPIVQTFFRKRIERQVEWMIVLLRAATLGEGNIQIQVWDNGAGGGWDEYYNRIFVDHLRDGKTLTQEQIETPEKFKKVMLYVLGEYSWAIRRKDWNR